MQVDSKFTNAAQVVSHEHVSVDLKADGPPGKEEVPLVYYADCRLIILVYCI